MIYYRSVRITSSFCFNVIPLLALAVSFSDNSHAKNRELVLELFVSPTAQSGDGTKSRPFGDIQKALTTALTSGKSAIVTLLPGEFVMNHEIKIVNPRNPILLRSLSKRKTILNGHYSVDSAIILKGSNIQIKGLVIRAYRQNGITINSADNVAVIGNEISNITSSRWSTGAVHLTHKISRITIKDNFIKNTGYSGVHIESSAFGYARDILISKNSLYNTCSITKDCGAVYVSGRSSLTRGITIHGNIVCNFGPRGALSKGIYLDDGLGDAQVTNNFVSGLGDFAVQIHGGGGNFFFNNKFLTYRPFLLNQSVSNPHENVTRPNVFLNNTYRNKNVVKVGKDPASVLFK